MERTAIVNRSTKETVISIELNLDGSGRAAVNTGIGFFDHMLESFARHGFFDLQVTVNGDLDVDTHHTVEDTGIVLGKAISQALGDLSLIHILRGAKSWSPQSAPARSKRNSLI